MSESEKDTHLITLVEHMNGDPIAGFQPPGYPLVCHGPNAHHSVRVTRSHGSCTLDEDGRPTQIIVVLDVEPYA